ncbi:MAG TPA: NmrA/HSCARG family protein [Bryobacteraceae bacterium]|nr:NmrA/HSCARG family protein [Bryobacteraceae bacterium]
MASHSNKTILVTGATGHQGGAAFQHLRRKFALRVLVQDTGKPEVRSLTGPGVELVRGNMDDLGSLKRAMDGAHGVYSVQTSNDTEAEVRQGTHMVDAAVAQSIRHFVYSSVVGADQNTGVPHFESKLKIEEHLRAFGLPHTILRPLFFMDNWFNWKDQLLSGRLEWPLRPETRLQMLAVDDIGAFVALAFEHPGKWIGRTFEMAGDELSMTQIAQAFSRMLGHEVKYVQLPWDEFAKRIDPAHFKMFQWFDREAYHVDIPAVRQELPGLHSFERWLQSTWRAKVPAEPVGHTS